jgi:hypothetical protein
LSSALDSCRSNESRWTAANRVVVDDLAQGVEATGIDARVFALLGKASLVTCAILVDDALRIVASSSSVHHAALSVDGAR